MSDLTGGEGLVAGPWRGPLSAGLDDAVGAGPGGVAAPRRALSGRAPGERAWDGRAARDRAAGDRAPAAWALAGPAQVRAAARRRHRRLLWARWRRPMTAVVLCAALGLVVRAWPSGGSGGATVDVWVAARDLPAGAALGEADQRRARWPVDLAPTGALSGPATGILGAPMSAGEPFTRARLLGAGVLTGQPADVVALAFPVPAALAAAARPGDRLRIVAAGRAAGPEADLGDVGDVAGDAVGSGAGSRWVAGVEEAVVLRGAATVAAPESGLLGGGAGASADQAVTVLLGVSSAAARRLASWDPQRVVVTLASPASGTP